MKHSMTNDQGFGELVKNWQEPPSPYNLTLQGKHCRLTPLKEKHAEELFAANSLDKENHNWRYLLDGPYSKLEDYCNWIRSVEGESDPFFLAVAKAQDTQEAKRDNSGDWVACGVASYMRISVAVGSIEVGSINFSPALQGTLAATEAMYLMMKWAFDNGYRRYEWKCNALNYRSRRAAQRLGFSYEGIFRQSAMINGHNRDTAWFAIIDKEWDALRQCFETYLAADNFDSDNKQRTSLSSLTRPLLFKTDPLFGE